MASKYVLICSFLLSFSLLVNGQQQSEDLVDSADREDDFQDGSYVLNPTLRCIISPCQNLGPFSHTLTNLWNVWNKKRRRDDRLSPPLPAGGPLCPKVSGRTSDDDGFMSVNRRRRSASQDEHDSDDTVAENQVDDTEIDRLSFVPPALNMPCSNHYQCTRHGLACCRNPKRGSGTYCTNPRVLVREAEDGILISLDQS